MGLRRPETPLGRYWGRSFSCLSRNVSEPQGASQGLSRLHACLYAKSLQARLTLQPCGL